MTVNRVKERAAEDAMQRYYQDRAPVYDRVYAYPERQSDLGFQTMCSWSGYQRLRCSGSFYSIVPNGLCNRLRPG